MQLIGASSLPEDLTPTQKKNFLNVQIDGIAIGLASAASPFLPVFLARLGATNFQVGLLTAMPGVTGLILAIIVGRFLQTRRQVVPWYSAGRLMVVSCYALTGLVPFIVPYEFQVIAVLVIWAFATLPQTLVNVCFGVVMNAVAGPKHRYDLMSRRWSTLGFVQAVTVAIVGQVLDRLGFPFNYQIVFIGLSLGGLISFYYSSHIALPDAEPPPRSDESARVRARNFVALICSQPEFVSFMFKRFVYISGTTLAVPLFPLYYVRQVQATDAWIGMINMAHTAIMLVGYLFWSHQSKRRGGRFVLLWTTLVMSLYPVLTALTLQVEVIVLYAVIAGIFQAGLDLVFFDELMKTFPAQYSATFVSIAQSLQHLATVAAPLVGTLLADQIGIGGALIVSGALRLVGFALFAAGKR
ncbi:MAG: MFS transporter [Chloroflexi bacterium]|nr:MFS transporter [Chloroflexota bacterium]